MAYTRRKTDKDATWQRAWTADAVVDLAAISLITGTDTPKHGDIAFVTANGFYYLWMDDGTWTQISGVTTPTQSSITPPVLFQDEGDMFPSIFPPGLPYNGSVIIDLTTTGTINNFNPGTSAPFVLVRCNNAALTTITGIVACPNQTITFIGVSAEVDFAHQSAGSSAGNKLTNFATSGPTPILLGSVTYKYNTLSSLWNLIAHEQGDWITPTFSAANFSAVAPMTWTVDAGDVVTDKFYLKGTTLFRVLIVGTTTVGGSVSAELDRVLPGGFTSAGEIDLPTLIYTNGAITRGTGFFALNVSGVTERFFRDSTLATSWVLSSNATSVAISYFTVVV